VTDALPSRRVLVSAVIVYGELTWSEPPDAP
jgi:hypothetical protein